MHVEETLDVLMIEKISFQKFIQQFVPCHRIILLDFVTPLAVILSNTFKMTFIWRRL